MRLPPVFRLLSSIWALLLAPVSTWAVEASPTVSLIAEVPPSGPAAHGLKVLAQTLADGGWTVEIVDAMADARGKVDVVVGLDAGDGVAAGLAREAGRARLVAAESLAVWSTTREGRSIWVVQGADERGLMYALLDVAQRVGWGADRNRPLAGLTEVEESPTLGTRAISLYTMNRAYWESRFYDEAYWTRYLDLLAQNRFNSMVVIFGYENAGFLAPCYPYFFDVEGFPEVRMRRISAAEQEKNLQALNHLIAMAHARGIEFKVGIWDHIYRGGVQAGGLTAEQVAAYDDGHLVDGVTAENLSSYTKAALTTFMQKVPELDGIQFRMHNESGLRRGAEMETFWTEVFTMIRDVSPDFRIDLRAKELPEEIIGIANGLGLNFTVTTKYWMEQMGLPFHPTHINRENQHDRRHGYADMLRYPRDYRIHWRLWTGGTQRALLWGDPDYVRRFAASTRLYDGDGFEVNEPLATKMEAQPHDEPPFALLNPPYQYYDYEFERYWHFFQVFGRLGYDPATPAVVWEREFARRFGPEAGPVVAEALHKASWVLPTIVAACSPYGKFPTTRGWAGKQRFGDLPAYAEAEGSDIEVFASFDTEARLLIEGGETARRLPSATSAWFHATHRRLETLIEQAVALVPPGNREFVSTVTDLRILSGLALYHARRIPAAVSYRIFARTGDPHALEEAIGHEENAIAAWRRMVAAAGEVYAPDLKFGMPASVYMGINHHLSGHWRDELGYLETGLAALQRQRAALGDATGPRTAPRFEAAGVSSHADLFQIEHTPVERAPAGEDLVLSARVRAAAGVKWVRVRYRAVNQTLDYATRPMTAEAGGEGFTVRIPADEIDPRFDFMYFIEVMDEAGRGHHHPDYEQATPYVVVKLDRATGT